MVERKKEVHNIELLFYCDFAGIQTRNLLIRSQMLYSVELRSHPLKACNKSDFAGIQTRNLLIRSQMLYSVELRSLFLIAFAKVILFIGKAEKQATIILRVNFY